MYHFDAFVHLTATSDFTEERRERLTFTKPLKQTTEPSTATKITTCNTEFFPWKPLPENQVSEELHTTF